jgi:hypothetical protein
VSFYGDLQTGACLGPQCSIRVYNPSIREIFETINAIVDSGAAMTCIPESAFREMGQLTRGSNVDMGGANNTVVPRRTYYLGIELPDFSADLGQVRVISLPHRYAIIGRDILNRYKIALDGCKQNWQLNCDVLCKQGYESTDTILLRE